MEQFPLWEKNSFSASQKLSAYYGNRKFITVLRTVYHLFLFWASWIQPTASNVICLSVVLVLFSHLSPGLLSSGFPTKIRVNFLLVQTTRPASSISSDLITRIIFCKKYSYKFTKVQRTTTVLCIELDMSVSKMWAVNCTWDVALCFDMQLCQCKALDEQINITHPLLSFLLSFLFWTLSTYSL
jgi:hypothetical protein